MSTYSNVGNRKRSSRACESCRSRKVRCDMQTFGSPCTNCLLNETVCQPAANARKLRRTTFLREGCSIIPEQTKHLPMQAKSTIDTDGETDQHPKTNDAPNPTTTDPDASEDYPSLLPPFVEPLCLPKDDLEYLQRKGAMSLPEWGLMTELLTSYCNWIHPQLPAIDLRSFLQSIFDHKTKKVSLLLLQTVLCVGAAFVEENVLLVHGYGSKIEAQDQFFQRAKLLYQAEYEDDPLVLAQAALLMSINHRCSKSSTIWLAQSHNVAERLGLQHMISYVSMDTATANACKRLWSCIFVRDCILNLELGTTKLFRNRPEDSPQLTAECFDKQDFSESVQVALWRAEVVHNPNFRLEIGWAAVKRAQLAALLCPIQALTTIGNQPLAPRSKAALEYLDRGLQSWAADFDNHANLDAESPVSKYQQGLLIINYLATRITLLQRCSRAHISHMSDGLRKSELGQFISRALSISGRLYSKGNIFCATSGMSTLFNIVNLAFASIVQPKGHEYECLVLEDIAICLQGLQDTCPRGSMIEFALRSLQNRVDKLVPEDVQDQNGNAGSESPSDSSINTPLEADGCSEVPGGFAVQSDDCNQGFEKYFEMLIDSDGGKALDMPAVEI